MRRLSLVVAAALACAAPPQPAPGWRILGPGGGGAQFHPTISPHDPNYVLVGGTVTIPGIFNFNATGTWTITATDFAPGTLSPGVSTPITISQ